MRRWPSSGATDLIGHVVLVHEACFDAMTR